MIFNFLGYVRYLQPNDYFFPNMEKIIEKKTNFCFLNSFARKLILERNENLYDHKIHKIIGQTDVHTQVSE